MPRIRPQPVEDDEVAPGVDVGRLRRGRPRLLVVRLAVDDRRIAVARVLADVLPDVEHRAAGRVHEGAAPALQTLESLHRHAERGNDADIRGIEAVDRVAEVVEETHAGRTQPAVDVRVVNDLAGQEDAPVREPMPCLIRVVDGAVDAVAEAELARQTHGQTTGLRGDMG